MPPWQRRWDDVHLHLKCSTVTLLTQVCGNVSLVRAVQSIGGIQSGTRSPLSWAVPQHPMRMQNDYVIQSHALVYLNAVPI